MILRDRIESCLRVLDKYHYVQCTTALPSARCSCGLHLVKSSLRANWHQLEAERDALAADLAAARAKIDSLRHHVKALQLLVKMQHAPQDMKLFAAEVDAIDAALAGKDAL